MPVLVGSGRVWFLGLLLAPVPPFSRFFRNPGQPVCAQCGRGGGGRPGGGGGTPGGSAFGLVPVGVAEGAEGIGSGLAG